MTAISQATQITAIVVGFFLLLALITFLRLILRKTPPIWRTMRIGFFVERQTMDEHGRPEQPPADDPDR